MRRTYCPLRTRKAVPVCGGEVAAVDRRQAASSAGAAGRAWKGQRQASPVARPAY